MTTKQPKKEQCRACYFEGSELDNLPIPHACQQPEPQKEVCIMCNDEDDECPNKTADKQPVDVLENWQAKLFKRLEKLKYSMENLEKYKHESGATDNIMFWESEINHGVREIYDVFVPSLLAAQHERTIRQAVECVEHLTKYGDNSVGFGKAALDKAIQSLKQFKNDTSVPKMRNRNRGSG